MLPVSLVKGQYGDFYWFYVNGLGFTLYLGKETPSAIRNVCAYHNSYGPVVVDKGFGEMVYGFIKDQLNSSQKSANLLSFLDGPKRNKQAES